FNGDLDLQTHDLGWYKLYPHGVEVEPGVAKLTTYASKQATDMGAIYVNSKGDRIVNVNCTHISCLFRRVRGQFSNAWFHFNTMWIQL
ncbi:hypothetical protein WP50_24870, partial [Lactiplantibacillus plantarum]